MNSIDRQIQLRDGRQLGYAEYGDPQGRPWLYYHGIPSSRLEAGLHHAAARRENIRVIAVDRPGYGLSDFQPSRKIGDWPDDVLQLVDGLGIGRFGVLGVSAGGPYALACAWKIPDRLSAVAIAGGLGPVYDRETLDAMRWHARMAFFLAQRFERMLRLTYGGVLANAIRLWPLLPYAWEMMTSSPPDRKVLGEPRVKACLVAAIRESLRQGSPGVLRDLVLYARHWGFSLAEINIPVYLWHGEADHIVPFRHTETMARALPHGQARLVPNEGHYSLPINHFAAITGAAEWG